MGAVLTLLPEVIADALLESGVITFSGFTAEGGAVYALSETTVGVAITGGAYSSAAVIGEISGLIKNSIQGNNLNLGNSQLIDLLQKLQNSILLQSISSNNPLNPHEILKNVKKLLQEINDAAATGLGCTGIDKQRGKRTKTKRLVRGKRQKHSNKEIEFTGRRHLRRRVNRNKGMQ